jgi:deoxycytidine triphosphate deaminase
MVLSDTNIRARIASDQLLSNHDPANVRNCAYTLRAGKTFLPESGEEDLLSDAATPRRQHVWRIGPSEVLVVRTRERVKMPRDLCATYAPLYRLSRQGVMLLNASLVEPGYDGPLSCFLVNFSSQEIAIAPDDAIAKITFLTLTQAPAALVSESLADTAYENGLAMSATKFHRSFMDVAGIANHAAEQATKKAKGAVVWGGVFIAFLLLWAQFEPLTSSWLRKLPALSASDRAADAQARQALDAKLKELEYTQKTLQLQGEVQALKTELQDLKSRVKK